MEQKDTVTVLLTGRKESIFAELISRMIAAKRLQFDMVCLKPEVGPMNQRISTTMSFKQELLKDLVFTYSEAEELRIYEDRPKHTKAFRDYFASLNRQLHAMDSEESRAPILAEVIQVPEQATSLDPVTEVAEVQRMINSHNSAIVARTAPRGSIPLAIKRTVFYTGYLISPTDTDRLLTLVHPPPNVPDYEMRHLANNIIITPRPASASILSKVGGLGATLRFKVTGLSVLENKLWAARVAPVDPTATTYSENSTLCVVLALRRNAKPIDANRISNWQPVPTHQAFEFDTVVGEKVLLRVEQERRGEDLWEASFPSARNARKHPREEDFPPLGSQTAAAQRGQGQGQGHRQSHGQRQGQGQGQGHANGGGENVRPPQQYQQYHPHQEQGQGQDKVQQMAQFQQQQQQFAHQPQSQSHNQNQGGYQNQRPGRDAYRNRNRGGGNGQRGGFRGGRGGGGGGGGRGGGRGRGNRGPQYRSLDSSAGSYGAGGMEY